MELDCPHLLPRTRLFGSAGPTHPAGAGVKNSAGPQGMQSLECYLDLLRNVC